MDQPKTPVEQKDDEIEHIHGTIIEEELFNMQEITQKLEDIKVLLSLLLLCLHLHSNAPFESD